MSNTLPHKISSTPTQNTIQCLNKYNKSIIKKVLTAQDKQSKYE